MCPRNTHEASFDDVKISTASHNDVMDRITVVINNILGKESTSLILSIVDMFLAVSNQSIVIVEKAMNSNIARPITSRRT
jgi:hypothetical protein